MTSAEVGERIDALLADLDGTEAGGRADELVRLLMQLYGAGLERMVEIVVEAADGPTLAALVGDPLVSSLLLMHDLHPLGVEERVEQALESVRPYLGSHAGGVEFLGVDDAGVAHLRLQGSCDGCASSTITVTTAIERAIADAAPDVVRVDVEGVTAAPKLVQIGSRPPGPAEWTAVTGLDVAPGRRTATRIGGASVVLCSVGGELYAYRDRCSACGVALGEGELTDGLLRCPSCQTGFDVRLAGRSADGGEAHLDPLPLLADDGQIRVLVPS